MKASTSAASRPRISCLSCGVECQQTRPWQRYCSSSCRRRDYEKRRVLPSGGTVGLKEVDLSVEIATSDEVPRFTTPEGRPLFRLGPCPGCGDRKFAWPIGSSEFVCVTCE